MPTYDYICKTCDERFEVFQAMSENALSKKPNCDTKNCNVTRLISGGAGLIFKGSGFYLTDYKTKDKPKDKAKSETSSSKKSEPKTQKKEP